MNEQKFTFNGGEVLAGQFSLDPRTLPFDGEPGISYRNITTAAEQKPSYVLSQTTPASPFGRENNLGEGDWVVRDALSMSNYRIVSAQAFQDGTSTEVAHAVAAEEDRALKVAALNAGLDPNESPQELRARIEREHRARLAELDQTHPLPETVAEKRARLQRELDALQ